MQLDYHYSNNTGISPFGTPFGKPFGEPLGKPFGEPFGEPFGKPFGEPFGKPFRKPFGNSFGMASFEEWVFESPTLRAKFPLRHSFSLTCGPTNFILNNAIPAAQPSRN